MISLHTISLHTLRAGIEKYYYVLGSIGWEGAELRQFGQMDPPEPVNDFETLTMDIY